MVSPPIKFCLSFSEEARDDIDEINAYTLSTWGERQVEKYATFFKEAFSAITNSPALGRARKGISKKFKCYNVGKHVIVYTLTQQDIFVVRVLHGKMHFSQHLG
jgi:toxin ParE1/3/4